MFNGTTQILSEFNCTTGILVNMRWPLRSIPELQKNVENFIGYPEFLINFTYLAPPPF